MKVSRVRIYIVSDTHKSLNFIVIFKRKSINFNIKRYFIPINMPTIVISEFFQIGAAFNFEYNGFFDLTSFCVFQARDNIIYPNIYAALFYWCHTA